ncbi:MAG TPA: YdeI/OmpD-associated family protein [Candidatus Saccharimonadales bacterium]|nr:YdeI/OmpD-associated family protein [Candidatus Saccharimonadales bacterium]
MAELKNPGPIEFDAFIEREESVVNSSAWILFPLDLKETYGKGNLVPIKAIFDGKVHYQGSLAKMGGRDACLILRKDVRAELGKEPGDKVHVVVELDTAQRKWPIAPDAKKALIKAKQLEKFESLAYSHQREYFRWIDEAKRPETRVARIARMCDMLAEGKKEPR